MKDERFLLWIKGYFIDPKYLSLFRIIYSIAVIVFAGFQNFSWIAHAPDYLFSPPEFSFANLFSSIPGLPFFQILTILNIIFFLATGLGIFTRISSVLFSVTSIIGYSFWYSFGKIDHTLLWFIMPLFMAPAGWGRYYSVDAFRKRNTSNEMTEVAEVQNSFWVFLFALTIAFSMFTAGIQKVGGGWLSPNTNASRYYLFQNYYDVEKARLLGGYFLNIKSSLFWKGMDYTTLFMEVGFLFSVISARIFRYFLVGAVVFHISVLLTLNIPFISNLLVYIVFIKWGSLRWVSTAITQLDKRSYLRKVLNIQAVCFGLTFLSWITLTFYQPNYKLLPGVAEAIFSMVGVSDHNLASVLIFYALYSGGMLAVVALSKRSPQYR